MTKLYLLLILQLVLLSTSCNSGGVIDLVPVVFMRQIQAAYFYEPGAPNSLHTSFAVSFLKGELDHRPQWYNKVELNPGDGTGWIDITEYHRDNFEHAATLTYALGYKHVYTAAGTYPVQARVTYWDNEVLSSQVYNFVVPAPAL